MHTEKVMLDEFKQYKLVRTDAAWMSRVENVAGIVDT